MMPFQPPYSFYFYCGFYWRKSPDDLAILLIENGLEISDELKKQIEEEFAIDFDEILETERRFQRPADE